MEWIPLKAIRKEREQRYASPLHLAEDIRNYMENRPLIAGPETNAYKLRKFIAKRRGPLAVAAAIALLLVAGIIGTSLGFIGQRRLRIQADALRMSAEQARLSESIAKDDALKQKDAAEKARLAETAAKDAATKEAENERIAKEQAVALRQSAEYRAYVANIAAADAALSSGEPTIARRLLADCPQELRNWEWKYLCARCDTSFLALVGHKGAVTAVAWSPDDKQIVTGSADKTARVWDAVSGRQIVVVRT